MLSRLPDGAPGPPPSDALINRSRNGDPIVLLIKRTRMNCGDLVKRVRNTRGIIHARGLGTSPRRSTRYPAAGTPVDPPGERERERDRAPPPARPVIAGSRAEGANFGKKYANCDSVLTADLINYP